MFKVGEKYSVHEMSSGEFRMAYDNFYAVVDGKFEEIAMWRDSVMEESMNDNPELTEEQAYKDAMEDVIFHIPSTYEGCKNVAVFVGIPPVGPGKGFDFYSTFECIDTWKDESEK